jgi:nitroimidazol reductase NimA-like FMN-containing flavoprotein (pyridoxamine 5'-phosphate oxidase superfamily)
MTGEEPAAEPIPSSEHWMTAEALHAGDAGTTPWSDARERLARGRTYWLATGRADGRPHVMPVLAVWLDGMLHFVAAPSSRKAHNLARSPQCVITVSADALDMVVEGSARKVREESRLRRVAAEYASKYAWHVTVRDGAFFGDGAPTAGPPPYDLYELAPATVFGFGTDETLSPTRWRFASL